MDRIAYLKKGAKGTRSSRVKGKISKTMDEYAAGELHSGSNGPVVKKLSQARAIALRQAGVPKRAG